MSTPSKITPQDKSGLSSFGNSMALSADGNTAVIGGYGDNNHVGAVWVFTRAVGPDAGVWSQQGLKLTGWGEAGGGSFGASVALAWDGNTLLVGGYGDNNFAGAAWLFTCDANGAWRQQGPKWTVDGGSRLFGISAALSWDGEIALVGASGDAGGAHGPAGAGAAWVFTKRRTGPGTPRAQS